MKWQFSNTHYRPVEQTKHLKIIDVGGANSDWQGHLNAIIDIRVPQASAPFIWVGDMLYPEFWGPVLNHVESYGKFDYCVCSHTLEDITHPRFVTQMIERIAKAGIIIVPSKHRELARFSYHGAPRGYWHHHWIFDIVDGEFVGFPKVVHIEDSRFDDVHRYLPEREELIIEWEGKIDLKYVNDGLLYDSPEHFVKCYDDLLNISEKPNNL